MQTSKQTTTQFQQDQRLEHFIPIAIEELVPQLVASQAWNSGQESEQFAAFAQRLIALYHVKFHAHYRFLKRYYQPFNPDQETSTTRSSQQFDSAKATRRFMGLMHFVVSKANYVALSREELNAAMKKTSPYGVEVSVNFDDFEEIALFYRGKATQISHPRNWKKLFLTKSRIETPVYRRMVLILKPKLSEELKRASSKNFWESDSLIIGGKKQGAIVIKLFKDIPHSDLEMLFPNIHVRIKLFDKLKIAITGGGGTIGGISATISKIAAAADPLAIGLAVFGLGGLIWRQVVKVFTQRTKYMAKLAQSLYYYNLDNNSGAISYLINLAEAEECKETLLTYYMLLTQGPCDRPELDKRVEAFLQSLDAPAVDFEIRDGINKLEDLELLSHDTNGNLVICDCNTAMTQLSANWNAVYTQEVDESLFTSTFSSQK